VEITDAAVLHSDGHIGPATVRIESGMIVEVDDTVPARHGEMSGLTLLPGFVDLHCHGGAGGDYSTGDAAAIERALEFHLAHGTTTTQISLMSAPLPQLLQRIEFLRPFVHSGRVHGVHLEGPWLARDACGAQDPAALSLPDAESVAAVVAAGRGVVSMVTLAPELPGALDAVSVLAHAGITVAVGHTRATYAQTKAAIESGARVATHLFNAMPPLHHRDPGPVGALLADPHVTVEIICDTVHLHPDVVHATMAAASERAALITDAVAAAGMTDVVPRVRETGALAGSILTMAAALRHAVVDCGVDLAAASHAASLAPARALGLFDRGVIAHAMRADVVAVDVDLRVHRVMRDGVWQG
jgi:N-acetylglucosamine-6-phosphate deacetylase